MLMSICQKRKNTGARPGRRVGVFGTWHAKIRAFAGEKALHGPNRRMAACPADQIQNA